MYVNENPIDIWYIMCIYKFFLKYMKVYLYNIKDLAVHEQLYRVFRSLYIFPAGEI